MPVTDVTRVVLGGEDFGQPVLGQFRLQLERRHCGKGHGQRASAASFRLGMQIGHRGPGDVRTLARVGPRQRRQAVLDGRAHQLVVGRMKLHQVDTMTIAVMTAELRLVQVGQKPCGHQRPARQRPVRVDPGLRPACPIVPRPLLQRQVEAIQIGPVQRWRLVGDFMGFSVLVQVHQGASWI
ncbi:hypothetical protein D3C79_754100 [compost metagenome]